MQITINKLMFVVEKDNKIKILDVTDETNHKVVDDLLEFMRRKLHAVPEQAIPFAINSFVEQVEVPFDINIIKSFLSRKGKNYTITSADGGKVTLYTAKASGEYPISGLDANGYPCLWDTEGNASDGNPDKKLVIVEKSSDKEKE